MPLDREPGAAADPYAGADLPVARQAPFREPLSAAAISAAINNTATNPATHTAADGTSWGVETVLVTGSTNLDLLQRARERAPSVPIIRAALEQSAGRGRAGRSWQAPVGAALLFSVAIPLEEGQALHAASALAAGIAIAELLRGAGVAVGLKWPNDLLLDGAKLGGILAEVAMDPRQRATIVIGVGINLWTEPESRAQIGTPVAALAARLAPEQLAATREAWLGQLTAAIVAAVRSVGARGFAPWRPRFEALFAWRERAVELREQGNVVATGIALGVDEHGQLLLRTSRGVETMLSGDLSLRLAGSGA